MWLNGYKKYMKKRKTDRKKRERERAFELKLNPFVRERLIKYAWGIFFLFPPLHPLFVTFCSNFFYFHRSWKMNSPWTLNFEVLCWRFLLYTDKNVTFLSLSLPLSLSYSFCYFLLKKETSKPIVSEKCANWNGRMLKLVKKLTGW